jgi:GntR family transcriptional regulator/MocR family aminotransferase
VILSAARRRALLDWAHGRDTWIVEDDYDSAYRFGAPPLTPLKGDDVAGRVLLVGSFSKTVFPALRLGYVVAPPAQLRLLALMKNLDDAGSADLQQAVLAGFLEDGHYQRHLRRSVRNNARRRRALIEALQHAFGGRLRLVGAASGLHLVADLGLDADQERRVVRAARRRGLGLYAQGAFSHGDQAHRGLVLGFGRLEPDALRHAVAELAAVVAAQERRRPPGR